MVDLLPVTLADQYLEQRTVILLVLLGSGVMKIVEIFFHNMTANANVPTRLLAELRLVPYKQCSAIALRNLIRIQTVFRYNILIETKRGVFQQQSYRAETTNEDIRTHFSKIPEEMRPFSIFGTSPRPLSSTSFASTQCALSAIANF